MTLSKKQQSLIKLLKSHENVLAYGGARSGKTFAIVAYAVWVCLTYPGARVLMARRYATDIRGAVWNDTIQAVMHSLDMSVGVDYVTIEQSMTINFKKSSPKQKHHSQIICAGLDDKERVDKVLGTEYTLIYLNEAQDIPWPTVKTLKSRLAQNVGYKNQLICDLNPVGVAHWTYKLFIKKIDPDTMNEIVMVNDEGNKLSAKHLYASIQLNPIDNYANLPAGYITRNLESLSGSARKRFLEGEFSTDDDLMVFSPPLLFRWPEFVAWVSDRWSEVSLVGGLDLGFADADAFCVLAWIPGLEDTWVVFERKFRRASLDELATAIKDGLDWVAQNIPNRQKDFDIYSDSTTIRHGKEGDSKKNASELRSVYGLPTRPAYKQDKRLSIDLLRDAVNAGKFHVAFGGPFAEETTMTVWTRLQDGVVIHEIDHDIFHPDMMDAIRYAYRFCVRIGNPALTFQEEVMAKAEEPLETTALRKMRDLLMQGSSRGDW